MMNKKIGSIAGSFVFISGVCLNTFGHYAEIWALGYFFSAMFGLIVFLVFLDE